MPNTSAIPTCPPLIDILSGLEAAQREFFRVPDSEDSKVMLRLITFAAKRAREKGKPFTKEYGIEHFDMLMLREEISHRARAFIEMESFRELVALMEWACQRINVLTGLSTQEIRETIERCACGKSLDFEYGDLDHSLNHVVAKLRELESDGTATRIWNKVWREFSIFRRAYELNLTPPTKTRDLEGEEKPAKATKGKRTGPRATTNALMLEVIQQNQDAMGWSSTQWAKEIKRSKSSIVETKTWENCQGVRDRKRAERAIDRRHKPRHYGAD